MATDPKVIDRILEKLLPLDVSARAMFGEYGLYHAGKNFALVCDDTLFVKRTDAGSAVAGRTSLSPPYPGAKPAFKISRARLNDRAWLLELVEVTCDALPTPKPKTKR